MRLYLETRKTGLGTPQTKPNMEEAHGNYFQNLKVPELLNGWQTSMNMET